MLRMYLPGIPAHIVQRGNNREPCFFNDDDYYFYLERLEPALKRYKVSLHAYVLMTNHVHLLMTPADAEGISRVMSLLGQQYVRHINKTYRRSGTLWEGRHKASVVNTDEYLLQCYRYIELNPVRAEMVSAPEAYPWSSYGYHAWNRENALIDDHELYLALGVSPSARCDAYRELFQYELSDDDIHIINQSIHYNYPLGNDRFREKIEAVLKRKVGYARQGRPKQETSG